MRQTDENSPLALRALAHGRVQGVNYRAFVLAKASQLKLTGFVHNLADGQSVEVIAEGPKANLGKLISYLNQGPAMAAVERVDITWTEPGGQYGDFCIKYSDE